jgi:2-polyprenyl-3-methyl-5-hydroxy-6-metoxy-1,4-benzoquinol methylase
MRSRSQRVNAHGRYLVNVTSHYQDANVLTRLVVAARPVICPMEPILAWIPAGASVLDLGCGVGLLSINLATTSRPRSIHGIDINPHAVNVAEAAARRLASVIDVPITFSAVRDFSEWPAGVFDVVCMVDVAHHVPRALWRALYQAAAARVRDGGLLLYKDMAPSPWWCGLGNRLHDLVLAQQWIEYCPLPFVYAALATAGMAPVHHDKWRRYWYAHEFTVFRKRSA